MLNEQKGFMSFIVLILGVSVVIGIALFSLNMQSRETFFLVHYYYLDSAREQLANSIQAESHDWIKNEMESTESAARKSILEKIHDNDFEDFTIDLDEANFSPSIQNSKEIAEFVGFEIDTKVHFKYLQPFFGQPKSTKYDSDGLIYPHPKECRGIFTIEVAITKDGVSSKVYEAWYNFRYINLLPPVVSRFSFFLKNQTKQNGFVGNINRLPMSNNEAKKHLGGSGNRGIIESERSSMRPLVIVNSLTDFQTQGQDVNQAIREFDHLDKLNNLDHKGWVFLGTDEPKGVILNLAAHNAFNFENGGFNKRVIQIEDSGNGKLYYGDYFHRQRGQEFKYSTSGEYLDIDPPINKMPMPYEDYEWGTDMNFILMKKLLNYGSLYKSVTYTANPVKKEEGLKSRFIQQKKRRIFASYYLPEDPSKLTEMGFNEQADYRSQHPSLIKPFGSYYYTNTPSRFYDNRSPTLILGPVRYSFMTVSGLRKEREADKNPPPSTDEEGDDDTNVAKPIVLPLPYANVDLENSGVLWDGQNFKFDSTLNEWKAVDITGDPTLMCKDSKKAGASPAPDFDTRDWGLFADTGPDDFLLDTDAEDTYFYWLEMGSAVWLDNYLHAYNAMISNGGSKAGGHATNVLKLDEIKSLDSTVEVENNDLFFFPDDLSSSQMFNGNRLILSEFSNNDSTHNRDLFKGKLGSLNLFSDTFKFNRDTGEMNSESYDLRFKASHLTDVEGLKASIRLGSNGECTLDLDGVVYVNSSDDKDADDPEVLELVNDACKDKKLNIKGKGIIIYDHDIVIPNDLIIEGADKLNEKRNKKADSKNPFELIEIAPVTLISVNGGIKLGNSVKEVYAYLVALDENNGTIGWHSSPPSHDVSIIGGTAIHHFDLNDIDLQEDNWLNGNIGADAINTPTQNIFHKKKGANVNGRLRIVFNNNFLPNVKENTDQHFNFVTSKAVNVLQ